MTATSRYFRFGSIFVVILSTLLCVQISQGAPQQPGAIPIVTDQTSVSLSNKFYNPGIMGLKENGDVFIGDGSALFRWDYSSTTLTRLLQVNDPIPNFSGSFAMSVANPLQLNAAGHAAIINTWASKDTKDPAGIFVYDGSTYSKIALTGEAVPGVADHVFSNFNLAVINQSDQVAFVAQYEPVGEYILGVFRGSPGNPVEKIATLQDIDDLTGTSYDNILLIGIDESGKAAFLCYDNYNPSHYGIFIGSPSGVMRVVAAFDSAPGSTSGQFVLTSNTSNYFLNAGGDLAFYSNVQGDASVNQGIWIRRSWGPVQKVVVNGDSTGTSLGGAFSGGLGIRGFNSAGNVLFTSNLSGASSAYGLFLKNTADPAQVVIYRGQAVPGRSELFNNINVARLNDSDNVALNSSLTGGSTSSGWFLGSGSTTPTIIVLQNDSTPIGGTYGPMNSSNPRFSNSGQLVFGADILGSNANGLFLWTDGSGVQGIVSTNDDLPSGANPILRFSAQSASDDEVIFFARKTGGKDTIFTKSLHPGDETIRRIVGDGDSAAGGSVITTILRPAINDNEEIVFSSSTIGGSIYHSPVLWVSQPGEDLQYLAMSGDSAPGSAGGTFSGFPSQARINNAGKVAFYGQIAGATGSSNSGIFIASLSDGVQKVVRLGDVSPAGGTFSFINNLLWFNESGQVLFRANSLNGSVTTEGLFVGSATSDPVKLVASGDSVGGGTVNFIGGFSRINNGGQVACYLNLNGSPNKIFLMAAGSAPVTLVSEDDPTPMPGGTFMELVYSNQDPGLVINDSGQVGFWAVYYLPGGGPILSDYGTGFFLVSPGSNPVARLISGQALPGGNYYLASFPLVGGTALSNSGELAIYVRSLVDAPDLPRFVIADKNGVLRNFAAAGTNAIGTNGEFSRLIPVVFLNSSGKFFTYSLVADGTPKVGLFVNGYASAAADFNIDRKTDTTVYRPGTGVWYTLLSGAGTYTATQWGMSGDSPVNGDFDGDGQTDIAVWRPASGVWFVKPSSDPDNYTAQQWGASTDKPVPADYDADGKTDVAVWRPGDGVWYILLSGSPGTYLATQWGMNGDVPAPADFDGDGKTDIAVWRPDSGTWFILPSGSPGSYLASQWGMTGDIPVPADYDGDGKGDLAVWRQGSGTWYILLSGTPGSYTATQWGLSADSPVPADYDGDGKTDIAVWRPDSGVWFVLPSNDPGNYTASQWGMASDIPVSAITWIVSPFK